MKVAILFIAAVLIAYGLTGEIDQRPPTSPVSPPASPIYLPIVVSEQ